MEMAWEIDSLKEYLDERFAGSQREKEAALASMEKRLDSLNEFRGQLSDQSKTFMTRTEYEANHKALNDKVLALSDRLNRSEGVGTGQSITMGKIYAAIGAVGAVLAIIVMIANNVFGN